MRYNKAFKNEKMTLPYIKENRTTSWHLYVIKVSNRDLVIEKLKENTNNLINELQNGILLKLKNAKIEII